MLNHLKTAILITVILSFITGFLYPVFITFLGQTLFPDKANGSLISYNGEIVGSKLIGQNFTSDKYFHSRPSEVFYNANKSGASNLGPTNKNLIEKIKLSHIKEKDKSQNNPLPTDLITSSASGLDPHISPRAAIYQASRVAKSRGLSKDKVLQLIKENIEPRQFKIFGEPRVNVLLLNIGLDKSQN